MDYVEKFLELNCSSDILEIARPINKYQKEISESMSIQRVIKGLTIKYPETFTIIDIGAGNGLTGLLCAYTLPVKKVIAIDKEKRDRAFDKVKHYKYIKHEIKNPWDTSVELLKEYVPPFIVVGSHLCGDLCKKAFKLSELLLADYVSILTCCTGSMDHLSGRFTFLKNYRGVNNYELWNIQLMEEFPWLKGRKDKSVRSPKDIILHGLPSLSR